MTKSTRLLKLLHLLRHRKHPATAAALAAELGISLRTLYRDINTLRAQGADLAACHSLPDHAALPAAEADFAVNGSLIISGKDAVKTAAWPEALRQRTYIADYRAELPPELLPLLLHRLGLA